MQHWPKQVIRQALEVDEDASGVRRTNDFSCCPQEQDAIHDTAVAVSDVPSIVDDNQVCSQCSDNSRAEVVLHFGDFCCEE